MPVMQLPSQSAITALGMSGGEASLGYNLWDSEYRDAFNVLSGQLNYRLVDLWGYGEDNVPTYAAIWEKCTEHPEQFTQHAIPAADYQAAFDDQKARGFRPVRVCGYSVGDSTMYAAIWEKDAVRGWQANHRFAMLNLANHLREVQQMGYRITDLSAYMIFEPNPDAPGVPRRGYPASPRSPLSRTDATGRSAFRCASAPSRTCSTG
jgi:Bacterial tandem repeat domain 1